MLCGGGLILFLNDIGIMKLRNSAEEKKNIIPLVTKRLMSGYVNM